MNTKQPKPNRKLQDYQVRILREMHRARYPQRFLRNLFGISHAAYYHIVNYGSYRDIK